MTRFVSKKLRFYSFICIALLLFVHGYNLHETYLQADSLVNEKLTFTTFFEYFFANGVLRFRLPLLFIISGYIFALQDKRPYKERIKKRFVTLILPYLIWSAVGLAVTYFLQQFSTTAQAVKNAQLDQLQDYRPYNEIGWNGILFRWLVAPVSFQLWFIKSLFFYNLLYPLLKWVVMKYTKIWFSIIAFLWLTGFGLYVIEGMGLLFFSFGIWLCKSNYPLDKPPKWFSHYLSWLCFIGFSVIKTFLAFELDNDGSHRYSWAFILLYAGSVIAGLLAMWFSTNTIVKWCMDKKPFVWVSAFAFVIYGLHVPLLPYFTRIAFMYLHNVPNYRLIIYIVVPLMTLAFCVMVGAFFRLVWPQAYKVATGGRGF